MKKETFLKLIEINNKSENLLNELYGIFSEEFIENPDRDFATTSTMLSIIMKEEYGVNGADIINYFIYEKPDCEYTKEKPCVTDVDDSPLVWDLDSLYNYVESLKTK
jgi:hypothetical protein